MGTEALMDGTDLYHLLWCHNSNLPLLAPLRAEMKGLGISGGPWADLRDGATLEGFISDHSD